MEVTLRLDEEYVIAEGVTVKLLSIQTCQTARFGFTAPREVVILREEVFEAGGHDKT